MTLETFYASAGGDYQAVKARLMTDERIEKFLRMFFSMDLYDTLISAIEQEDWPVAFRSAHTMKGTAADVGLSELSAAASELCETLRPDDAGEPAALSATPACRDAVVAAYGLAKKAQELMDA